MYNKSIFYFLIFFCLFTIPSKSQTPQQFYLNSFSEIQLMLSETDPLDFRKAVYLTENAYSENKLDHSVFENTIWNYTLICKGLIESGNIIYPEKDKEQANAQCAVFILMTDTIPIQINQGVIIHTPFEYNFDDYAGQKDWSNMFVSTLMLTKKGNCHSLPYLYKIIMNELGYESHLSLAPNHIYIKANNKRVGWYNIELTCRDFPTDVWYAASGYIHTDAIRNGLYMKALSEKESIALCMVDLAQGYQSKFGIEDGSFIIKCCDTALTHFPNYINALLLKAETITALHKQAAPESEESEKLFVQMNELYTIIHKLGYRKMPQSMYLKWLKRMGTEDIDYRIKSIMIDKNEIQQN